MRTEIFVGVLAFFLILLLLAYLGSETLPPAYGMKDDSAATKEGVRAVAEGINRFGVDLLKEIEGNRNVFVSPVSVEFALAIAAEGARGETFDEMVSALHLPVDHSLKRPAFAHIYNMLNRKSSVTIELANALWLWVEPEENYMHIIQRYYPADVFEGDSVERINAWVRERTHGRIDRIIDTLPPRWGLL